jgi:hypothetical protein
MADVQTSKVDAKLHQSIYHEIVYSDRYLKDELFNKTIFVKTKKKCGGWSKVKIHILVYGDHSWATKVRT